MKLPINEWTKYYESGGWKGIIVPEAFSHPAKMSYGLLKRILAHVEVQGWLNKGDVIVDPFGGIGSTGILGAYEGYQVVCVELERKFVDLARKNFVLHNNAWYKFGNPYPVIIQGDSRRLCEVVEKADCIVSSPPYAESSIEQTHMTSNKRGDESDPGYRPSWKKKLKDGYADTKRPYGQTPGQLGSMKPGNVDMVVSSPPYAEGCRQTGGLDPKPHYIQSGNKDVLRDYGQTPGNLGNLKSGDVDAIISSPPYSTDQMGGGGQKHDRNIDGMKEGYGKTEGQLTNLKSGDVDCVISSPPYEKAAVCGTGIDFSKTKRDGDVSHQSLKHSQGKRPLEYGHTQGQLGHQQGDTFWQAAKTIVEQCFQILKPGGHAIWVVKSFVRNKKIVDFPGDWQRLCESVGFKTVCIHHAMLVKETAHKTLFGDTEVKRTERKSFFRRLAESKGSPRIDYEVVLCMLK